MLKEILGAYLSKLNKGILSRLYYIQGFMTKKSHSTEYVKNKWENEGNFEISKEEWYNYWIFQWKCTNSHTWREFGWKCLIRFFITPKQKAHFIGEDSGCWRLCGSRDANHWRIFWECPVIRHFWLEIHKTLESIFNVKIPFQFCIFILGKASPRALQRIFIWHSDICKKTITRCWLLPDSPTIEEWKDIVNEVYLIEKKKKKTFHFAYK